MAAQVEDVRRWGQPVLEGSRRNNLLELVLRAVRYPLSVTSRKANSGTGRVARRRGFGFTSRHRCRACPCSCSPRLSRPGPGTARGGAVASAQLGRPRIVAYGLAIDRELRWLRRTALTSGFDHLDLPLHEQRFLRWLSVAVVERAYRLAARVRRPKGWRFARKAFRL